MTPTDQGKYTAPSGRCDTCVHGQPLDGKCITCEAEIVAGLADVSAERVMTALEILAAESPKKMASYQFVGSFDELCVIHRDNVSWMFQPNHCRSGDYAYRMLWSGAGPSEALNRARASAVALIACSKERLVKEPVR